MRNALTLLLFLCLFTFTKAQTANFWTKKNDFSGLKRERAVAFVVNDVAFVGTGIDTSETVLKDFWKYDQITDSWSQVADLPGEKRRNAIAFAIGNFGYVGSGINSDSSTEPGAAKLSDFYKYDPQNNSWQTIAPFPGGGGAGVYFATGFAIDSKGYLCGGKFGPNSYSNQLWEYKPSIDQWAQLTSFPGGVRYQLSSFVIGTKGYVGLGTDQDLYRNDFYAFNAATNQWSAISELPASERSAAMTFSIGNRGFVCMGSNGGLLGDLWEYNPDINDWAVRAPYGGSERKGAVGFAIGGKGYVGTGKGYSGKKESFWEYTPQEVLGLDAPANLVFTVYPNPTSDYVKVNSSEDLLLEIYSMEGTLIRQQNDDWIDLTGLPKGSYRILAFNANSIYIGQTNVIKL
jgi:N-acetylneuraminic acid mutarotase